MPAVELGLRRPVVVDDPLPVCPAVRPEILLLGRIRPEAVEPAGAITT